MDEAPIITVEQGQLIGKISTDYFGSSYFSFQGIPYAEPPIGALRFKAPKPPLSWTGVRDATKHGNASYSRHTYFMNVIGAEDCLFLNVYTPKLTGPLKPVMFWIHGGGYTVGSGNPDLCSPDFLIHEDVVIVTINYRLGVLGFLSLNDPDLNVPGNAGLKDQVMALKWVRANIDKFRGDPNNITIFGESVGGGSVHFLMMSPLSKGLFHKAIIQSGSCIGNRGRGQYSTPLITEALGLTDSSDKNILKLLQNMPLEKIFEIQEQVPDHHYVSAMRPFGVVVERYENEDTFLSREPMDIIKSGQYHDVPLMIGFTSREGYFARIKYNTVEVDDFEKEIMFNYKTVKGSELSLKIARKIKEFFYGDEDITSSDSLSFAMLQGDNMFVRPVYNTVRLHTKSSKHPIYFFRVSINSKLNIFKRFFRINEEGVCHGDDLGYLFRTVITPKIKPRSVEENGMKVFTKYWSTFAKTGNPNPSEKQPFINVEWKPVEENKINFVDIGENITVGINPEESRMAFWDEVEKLCNFNQ
ncbi:hypothetical protein FQA39_LY02646 [Lamprigera yunnana]|nr:hypothetical protein FQA39_LY02646 [Lamprigera yunnana]